MKSVIAKGKLNDCGERESLYGVLIKGAILFGAYYLGIGISLSLSFDTIIKSCLMNIMGVLLPGAALFTLLIAQRSSLLDSFIISYVLGYIFNIASYFILVPFGAASLIPLYVGIIALVSFIIIYINQPRLEIREFSAEEIPFVVLFFIYMILITIAYAGCNIMPIITGAASYPTDLLYWIENAAALAREFPPSDPRIDLDITLYYHYFSSIQIAYLNLATGVDIFTLGVSFFSLGKSILFFGSFYLLLKSLINSKKIVFLGLIVISFGTGFEGLIAAGLTYIAHTWTHPFGFDVGFSMGAIFLYFFILQYKKIKKFDIKLWILSMISFAALTGLKAPIAVVIILEAGIICFWWLINRSFNCAFSYGIGLLLCFLIIAVGCAGLGITSGQVGELSFSHFISSSPILSNIYEMWGDNGGKIFIKFICALLYCILVHPLFFVLIFASFISMLIENEMRNILNVSLLLSALFGVALGIVNIQPGQSQSYFTMAAFIPSILLGCIWLDKRAMVYENNIKAVLIKVFCALLACIQIYFSLFCRYTYWGDGLISSWSVGVKNILGGGNKCSQEEELQKSDLDAFIWIRDTTPKDSIVLSDRSILGEEARYYMYCGAFSERQMYIEGDIYFRERYVTEREEMVTTVREVFLNSEEALSKVISDGVDYIVQTKWLTPNFKPNDIMTELVYESDTIKVYKICN